MPRPLIQNAVGYTAKRNDGRLVVVHRHLSAPDVLAIVPVEQAQEIANQMFAREGLTDRVQRLLAAVGTSHNYGGCL